MRFDPQSNCVSPDDSATPGSFRDGRVRSFLRRLLAAGLALVVITAGGVGFVIWSGGGLDLLQSAKGDDGWLLSLSENADAASTPATPTTPVVVSSATEDAPVEDPAPDPGVDGADRERARHAVGEGKRLMGMGKYTEAMPHLRRAVIFDPTLAEAHYTLGLASIRTGDEDCARQALADLRPLDRSLAGLLGNVVPQER